MAYTNDYGGVIGWARDEAASRRNGIQNLSDSVDTLVANFGDGVHQMISAAGGRPDTADFTDRIGIIDRARQAITLASTSTTSGPASPIARETMEMPQPGTHPRAVRPVPQTGPTKFFTPKNE